MSGCPVGFEPGYFSGRRGLARSLEIKSTEYPGRRGAVVSEAALGGAFPGSLPGKPARRPLGADFHRRARLSGLARRAAGLRSGGGPELSGPDPGRGGLVHPPFVSGTGRVLDGAFRTLAEAAYADTASGRRYACFPHSGGGGAAGRRRFRVGYALFAPWTKPPSPPGSARCFKLSRKPLSGPIFPRRSCGRGVGDDVEMRLDTHECRPLRPGQSYIKRHSLRKQEFENAQINRIPFHIPLYCRIFVI